MKPTKICTLVKSKLSSVCQYHCAIHFVLYERKGETGVRWKGLYQKPSQTEYWWTTHTDFSHLSSARSFVDVDKAIADCLFSLHRERGYCGEASAMFLCELALPIGLTIQENKQSFSKTQFDKFSKLASCWDRLCQPDRDAIASAIQDLPEHERAKALRAELMPDQ